MNNVITNDAYIQQRLPVTDGVKVIEKAVFGPLVNNLTLGRKVNWDTSKYELEGAWLVVRAKQDVTSGASLTSTVNEEVQSPVMRWHALETIEKTVRYPVASKLLRGENVYVFSYETSGLHQLAATLSFSAELELLFRPLGKGGDSTPADEGKEDVKGGWEKFVKSLGDNAKTIVIIGTIAAILGGIGYIYYKTSVFGKAFRFLRR
jgi:hypothetical protein